MKSCEWYLAYFFALSSLLIALPTVMSYGSLKYYLLFFFKHNENII